ncbi:MAG TPA: hypothetical protein VLT59_07885, partial [Steroidobacteraceae bacterium]|nr:hypothetical protein [Steroidobacteraceae bacterium]
MARKKGARPPRAISRRSFMKISAASAGTLLVVTKFGGIKRVHAEPIPGGTLAPDSVTKYVTPLLIPPVMPRAGQIVDMMGKNTDYYEISVKQFAQQILPAGLPATKVWGYGAITSANKRGLKIHNAPS